MGETKLDSVIQNMMSLQKEGLSAEATREPRYVFVIPSDSCDLVMDSLKAWWNALQPSDREQSPFLYGCINTIPSSPQKVSLRLEIDTPNLIPEKTDFPEELDSSCLVYDEGEATSTPPPDERQHQWYHLVAVAVKGSGSDRPGQYRIYFKDNSLISEAQWLYSDGVNDPDQDRSSDQRQKCTWKDVDDTVRTSDRNIHACVLLYRQTETTGHVAEEHGRKSPQETTEAGEKPKEQEQQISSSAPETTEAKPEEMQDVPRVAQDATYAANVAPQKDQKDSTDAVKPKEVVKVLASRTEQKSAETRDATANSSEIIKPDIEPQGPLRGLVNQASTCYLNSLLQALYMTPEFRNGICSITLPNGKLAYEMKELFNHLKSRSADPAFTMGITACLGTEVFQQRDIQECWHEIFDVLEKELIGTDQEKLMHELYRGEMEDQLECAKGHLIKTKVGFTDLPLVVKPRGHTRYYDVMDSLGEFISPQDLVGSDQPFCKDCNRKQDGKKQFAFQSFPKIVTLHLMRFQMNRDVNRREKTHFKITFPFTMDITSFLDQQERSDKTGCEEKPVYELFAVLVHNGRAESGHYYAYIKPTDEKWHLFNDECVYPVEKDDIKSTFGGTESRDGSAYMLMYRRQTEDDRQRELKILLENEMKGKSAAART